MITVTVGELLDSKKAFSELLEIELDAVAAYKIARIAKSANDELSVVQDSLNKLTEKYVNREKGEFTDDEAKGKYIEEFEDLKNTEVNINAERLDVSVLGDAKVKPGLLLALVWVLEE